MTFGGRHAFRVAVLSAALSFGAGCAKEATEVLVVVDAEAAVPPILILRASITLRYDPSRISGADLSSPYASDAADRPGPFVFPLSLPRPSTRASRAWWTSPSKDSTGTRTP